MKTQKEMIKTVGLAFDALSHVFYNKNTNFAEAMLQCCITEEKGHRGFGHDFAQHHPNAATIRQCAKMFCVKRVAEYLLNPDYPKGADFLHFCKSAFWAAGIAQEFGEEIKQAWSSFNLQELNELDYVMFVSPEKKGV